MMKKLLLFMIFALLSLVPPILPICHTVQEMDQKCAMEIVYFGNRHLVLPVDDQHYAENCGIYEDGMNCLENYVGSCLSGLTQKIGGSIVKNVRAHYSKRCKDPTFRASFIQHNQCFRNATVLEQFHQCADRWNHLVEQMRNYNSEFYVTAGCCIFLDFQKCIEDKTVQLCHDSYGKYWNDALNDMSDETMETYCQGHVTLEQCITTFPHDIWNTIISTVNQMDAETLRGRNKFSSIFFITMDLLNEFKL